MHVQWCAERYTSSYHASDNTYATSKGTRVECRSPY
ncbi:BA14K family protein [Agrobacterium sp. rho-13.3]|nr:BA14K family protein [Agrobacterium sp. rho-13.3]MDX8308285.1 BA14K family protein [Agrobacterium sp. rho-13.3]